MVRKTACRARIVALNEASRESKPFRPPGLLSKLQFVSCDLTVSLSGRQSQLDQRREHILTFCARGARSLTHHGRSKRGLGPASLVSSCRCMAPNEKAEVWKRSPYESVE